MASAGRILIMPKGNYDSSATYEMLDMVYHNGKTWLAKKTTTGIEPNEANSEHWHNFINISTATIGAIPTSGGIASGHIYRQKEIDEVVYNTTYAPSIYKVGNEVASGVMHFIDNVYVADSILLFNKNGVELLIGSSLAQYKIFSELNKPKASDIQGLENFIKQVIANNK